MARVARADRALRAASRHLRADRAASAGRRAAARRPRRPRRDARRRDLHGLPVRPAAPEPRSLHARPRDGDPARWSGATTAGCARRTATGLRRARSRRRRTCPRIRFRRAAARGFRRRHAADRVPVAALAVAGGALQPDRAAGTSAALRTRDDREPLPAVAGRAAAAGALLQRVDGDGVRARALPADGRPRLLLRRSASSTTSTSRTTRRSASTCA